MEFFKAKFVKEASERRDYVKVLYCDFTKFKKDTDLSKVNMEKLEMRRLLLTENMKIKMADNYNELKEANDKRNIITPKKQNTLRRTWAKDKLGHVV